MTIGPAPMIMMDVMSVRLGMKLLRCLTGGPRIGAHRDHREAHASRRDSRALSLRAPRSALHHPDEPPELAEIRLAVIDRIREKSYRSGGKKVFPFDLLRVNLHGVEESRVGIFTGRFFRNYLEQEIHNALRGAGCRFPEDLRVEVEAAAGLPKPREEWLTVDVGSQEPNGRASKPAARLVVCEGTANTPEIGLDQPRTNIGRVVDVYRSEGLHRRNGLARRLVEQGKAWCRAQGCSAVSVTITPTRLRSLF